MNKNNQKSAPEERPVGVALAFLFLGLLTIAAATGNLDPGVEAWLWNLHDDPAPAWVWASGGIGCALWSIFALIPQQPQVPNVAAGVLGMVGMLHLIIFFFGAFVA